MYNTLAEEVNPGTVGMAFRGGPVDENLVKIYEHLYEKDLLETKSITVEPGQKLERRLIEENVLAFGYRESLDHILRELNKENTDVKVPETPKVGHPIRWTGDKPVSVIVPDLSIKFTEEKVPITLDKVTDPSFNNIKELAKKKDLLRPSIGPIASKKRQFENWNPVPGDESVDFPADVAVGAIPVSAVPTLHRELGVGAAYGIPNVSFVASSEESDELEGIKQLKLVWNPWFEGDKVGKITQLKRKSDYRLFLHLSPFRYGSEVSAQPAIVREFITEWLATKDQRTEIELTAVMLFDEAYLQFSGNRTRSFRISVKKMRDYVKTPQTEPRSAFDEFAEGDKYDQPFVFGTLTEDNLDRTKGEYLDIRTKGESGWTVFTVVLFSDDNRPIDEVTFPICVDVCDSPEPMARREFDPTEVGLGTQSAVKRDASLYVIELPTKTGIRLYGLFHTNNPNCKDYCVWEIDKKYLEFASSLENWLKNVGESSESHKLLKSAKLLTSMVFPCMGKQDTEGDCTKAMSDLAILVSKNEPPSLFVRAIPLNWDVPLVFPAGLLVVKNPQDGTYKYVGRHMRIEIPLARQSYDSLKDCPGKWVTVFPPRQMVEAAAAEAKPADDREALLLAYESMGEEAFESWNKASIIETDDEMANFEDWLSTPGDHGADGTTKPITLAMLSHHKENRFYFRQGHAKGTQALTVARKFVQPSIALINACEVQRLPRVDDFIYRLNHNGVDTVLTTTTNVHGKLAGDFYRCLDDILRDNAKLDTYPISHAFYDAITCVWEEKNPQKEAWEANALRYVLLGNPDVRLCAPPREVPYVTIE